MTKFTPISVVFNEGSRPYAWSVTVGKAYPIYRVEDERVAFRDDSGLARLVTDGEYGASIRYVKEAPKTFEPLDIDVEFHPNSADITYKGVTIAFIDNIGITLLGRTNALDSLPDTMVREAPSGRKILQSHSRDK